MPVCVTNISDLLQKPTVTFQTSIRALPRLRFLLAEVLPASFCPRTTAARFLPVSQNPVNLAFGMPTTKILAHGLDLHSVYRRGLLLHCAVVSASITRDSPENWFCKMWVSPLLRSPNHC